ncbi:MAG: integration host factor subunit beta [bacterium TMED198]|nr:MAG: integration host factor subunit beta [bacterium TMED198]
MTKADIVNEISSKTGLTKIETEVVINSLVISISDSLMRGERVDIRGFGSFYIKKRDAREARNPSTNEVIKLSERFVPYFKVSKLLKDKVNKTLLRGF